MTERGEWRGIYTVLQSTPEFTDLSPEAQLVWFHLKLRLGAAGIDSVPALEAVLSEVTGYPRDTIADGIEMLSARGWIRRQRSVVWLVNGLRYEPSRNMDNGNHVRSVVKHIMGLPKLKIVNDFAEYYGLEKPFEDEDHPGYHRDSIPDPSPITEDGIRNTEDGNYNVPSRPPRQLRTWPARPGKTDAGHYDYPEAFEHAWAEYPPRDGGNPKLAAYKAFRARVKAGDQVSDLVLAATHYRQHCEARGKDGTPYVQQASTFYGPGEPFREFVDGPGSPPSSQNGLSTVKEPPALTSEQRERWYELRERMAEERPDLSAEEIAERTIEEARQGVAA